eukprot:6861698-Pyramimonas_sp.AAC.1
MIGLPWEERLETAHAEMCDEREMHARVSDERIRQAIISIGCPVYSKHKRARGRALSKHVPEFNLLAKDRIEPGYDLDAPGTFLTDPAELETKDTPVNIGGFESLFRGAIRYEDLIGTSPYRTLALDILHAFCFGPVSRWTSCVLWRAVNQNPWGIAGDSKTVDEQGRRRLRGMFLKWQEDQ